MLACYIITEGMPDTLPTYHVTAETTRGEMVVIQVRATDAEAAQQKVYRQDLLPKGIVVRNVCTVENVTD
jgi:hypothetical protein